jgi:hypothetical protein
MENPYDACGFDLDQTISALAARIPQGLPTAPEVIQGKIIRTGDPTAAGTSLLARDGCRLVARLQRGGLALEVIGDGQQDPIFVMTARRRDVGDSPAQMGLLPEIGNSRHKQYFRLFTEPSHCQM